MFENGISTLIPLVELYLNPFWCSSRLPIVFLPSRFGLTTTFSRVSLLPGRVWSYCWVTPYSSFSSSSWSCTFTFLMRALIFYSASLKWLFSPLRSWFLNVTSLTNTTFGSVRSGNCRAPDFPTLGVWKLILRYVQSPSPDFETVFTVLIWNGTNWSAFTGSKIVSFYSST